MHRIILLLPFFLFFNVVLAQPLFSYDKSLVDQEMFYLDSVEEQVLRGAISAVPDGLTMLTRVVGEADTLGATKPFNFGFYWGFCTMSTGFVTALLFMDSWESTLLVAPVIAIACSMIYYPQNLKGDRRNTWIIIAGDLCGYALSAAIFYGGLVIMFAD